MKKFIILAMMAMAVAVVLSACGTESKIKGSWVEDSAVNKGIDEETYQFKKGNKFWFSTTGEEGKYKVEGNKIKLDDKHNTVLELKGDKLKGNGKTYKKDK